MLTHQTCKLRTRAQKRGISPSAYHGVLGCWIYLFTVKPGCSEPLCNEFLDFTKFFNSPFSLPVKPIRLRPLCNEGVAAVNLDVTNSLS